MIDEIKDEFSSHALEMSFLAQRLAELTNIENAGIKNRVGKSSFIDKYDGNVLFSYTAVRLKPSLVFIGNIALEEVIERVRNINSKKEFVECAKKSDKNYYKHKYYQVVSNVMKRCLRKC